MPNTSMTNQTVYLTSLDKDVIALAQDFLKYPSITPDDQGCLTHLADLLGQKGWQTHIVQYDDVINLYARMGTGSPHLCFAGHVDVVPTGPVEEWAHHPFGAEIHDGILFGRGIADMKGAIACFLSAVHEFSLPNNASISILLTSDEEGDAINGTKRMVDWMRENQQYPDVFLIGEPTGNTVGSVIQIGRRGSLTGQLTVLGKQGHIAYPENFDNPVTKMVTCAHALKTMALDRAPDPDFEPSRLEFTSIDTGNLASNVIWGKCQGRFGIRFNTQHNATDLSEKVKTICREMTQADPKIRISGDPFLINKSDSKDREWLSCVHRGLRKTTHQSAQETTQGGITDGRFLTQMGPVLEVGLPEQTIHQINEQVSVEDLHRLKACYANILTTFFYDSIDHSLV
ncbi:MAG: succinyl-diaminopimelate desuccinylase [Alphaproteobacteria bacterium]|nr:succinyl-diaminopimelate desuccinylase [Alphaproteobacteria bacterium]